MDTHGESPKGDAERKKPPSPAERDRNLTVLAESLFDFLAQLDEKAGEDDEERSQSDFAN